MISLFERRPSRRSGRDLIVRMARALEAGAGHGPGGPVAVVGPRPEQRGMVGRDQDAAVAVGFERLEERADDVAVDPLERLDLGVGSPLVARLVGGLDVNADEVVILQGLDRRTDPWRRSRYRDSPSRPARRSGPSRRASPTPRTRSTAEMIAPLSPCRSLKRGRAGALPCPQSQIGVGRRLAQQPAGAWLTGWSFTTAVPAFIRSRSTSDPVPRGR